MSLPVPLGVRLYTIVNPTELWVTRFVDDIEFRSVVPGGFASATITLHLPRGSGLVTDADVRGFPRIVELFNRVQVVDLRSAEVAWEGRIEDPARQVDPDVWQIGALGTMVAATDIQRPVFYIDSDISNWVGGEWTEDGNPVLGPAPAWSNETVRDTTLQSTQRADNALVWTAGDSVFGFNYSYRWDSHGYDQAIARFTTTHDGAGPDSTQEPNFSLVVGIASNHQVDVTGFEASSDTTKSNVIGTDFTDTNTRYILLGTKRDTGSYTLTDATKAIRTSWHDLIVVGVRLDRFGNHLTTAASYPGNYVTVAQVVEDVVGRFLVGGWYELGLNTPWPGSVRGQDVYIDTSDTTQILHLAYPNGTTAADILNDLVSQVQPNAYWAIWESKYGAYDANAPAGFRFEWATWPANVGYTATSQDGFEGQPNGDDVYNFVFYRYPDSGDSDQYHVTTSWQANEMAPELLTGGFTRAVTVNKNDPTDEATADSLRDDYLASKHNVLNAGTLTVRRPIQYYDTGNNSWSGGGRLLDPWLIRPGKLVRITDLPPRNTERDVTFGATPPNQTLNGTIFRVVATDYSSSDNTCRMSLDQVTTWQLPTQISKAGSTSKTIRIQ